MVEFNKKPLVYDSSNLKRVSGVPRYSKAAEYVNYRTMSFKAETNDSVYLDPHMTL